ncbi:MULTISPECIES: GTPase family protein [Pseudomonas]|uniref:GTPase family protein n=1 Tax=Pseudomonas TaxID=286 RepID=UPI00174BC92A|nr:MULTISPECIES: GTPase [Pseudomonas]MBJ7560076.1 50S ribosome-binding GTPase [Pseudomonas sp. P20]MBJ7566716.1 50S ribosome-binding GTPase [Pseudomonas sp. P22]MBM0727250.1 50S ribosome-binding GTPase [Pseudomonas aeruginosa]MBM2511196.1 50S ribosome-binding GTPase [Pseudomonas aeruginosa]MBM2527489.1 50S ribosome-binding GTPase [Pseudomonas aeruginosa]
MHIEGPKNPSLQAILDKIEQTRNYTPKVGIFGNSGVGKSSLCNALFGKNVAKISDVEACTREPQSIFIGTGNNGIELIDLPGIGEDPARQMEYVALYESLAPELDLVLWTIKADDRNYASGLEAYQQIFGKREGLPVVFVITQVDKTNPHRDWDWNNFVPSEKQISNIAIKERDVSRRFDISAKNIISVAVGEENPNEKYNVIELVDLIVEVLPNEKKFSFAREAKEDNVSNESRQKAERGVWDSIKDFAGDAWDTVKDQVVDKLIESAPKIFAAAAAFVGGLFKKWL